MTVPEQQIAVPPGLVVITTFGSIRQETAQCMQEMRSFNEANGLRNVKYQMIPGTLVEKARNDAVRVCLKEGFGFLLFVDGDMTFDPDVMVSIPPKRAGIVQAAYGEFAHADVMGGYCNLRGDLALPTIDSGTGMWESWFPNSGVPEVMRTGAAFLLVKRHCFERLKDPWFRMRVPARPVDFMAEVDNWARMKFDGVNPMRNMPNNPWERLEKCAQEDPAAVAENFVPVEVGEDSGFCDRARNAGLRIFVNTNIVCGHVDTRILTAADHKKAVELMERETRLASGLLA